MPSHPLRDAVFGLSMLRQPNAMRLVALPISGHEATLIGTLNEGPLHASLKQLYVRPGDRIEIPVDGYIIRYDSRGTGLSDRSMPRRQLLYRYAKGPSDLTSPNERWTSVENS